jgi:hypothetical protein
LATHQYAIQVGIEDEKHRLKHGACPDRNCYLERRLLQPSQSTVLFRDIKLNRNNFLKMNSDLDVIRALWRLILSNSDHIQRHKPKFHPYRFITAIMF